MEFQKTLYQTVQEYGLMAKKSLGQNFLLDQNVTDKIVSLSLGCQGLNDLSQTTVLEVGPGPGGLTRAILKKNPKVFHLIEKDERFVQIMEDLKTQTNAPMNIFSCDALHFDIQSLKAQNLQIFSNLPYNISVPLLMMWLKNLKPISAMTLMFQKEVADRIMAPIKTKDYGRISVISQLLCDIQRLWTLSPSYFTPAPKVSSSVLLLRPLKIRPSNEEIQKVEKLTALAFSGRRKMIRQSLKSISNIDQICEKLHIPTTLRAEEIEPSSYLEIAKLL